MLGLDAAEPGGDAAGLSPQELGSLSVCVCAMLQQHRWKQHAGHCSLQCQPGQGAAWDAKVRMERGPVFSGCQFGRKAQLLGQFSAPFDFPVA